MGICIKGMEMPHECDQCTFFDDRYDYPTCGITQLSHGYNWNPRGQRMPDCPLIEIPCDYDELLKAAQAMHTWIFLHSGNEELAYKACGLSDEMNAFLGYSGSLTLTI